MNGNGSFGNWLKQRRKALDLTQVDLADQVGCSVITIQKIEADDRRPSKQITERLADVLAIAPDERTAFVTFARRSQASPPLLPVATSAALHNLPTQPTSFIGRDAELAQISERLDNPACRLLTLVGTGGIGKTRLALQAASERVKDFAHGVYFVALAAVNSPDLLASAVASALKMSLYGPQEPTVQVINYLREKHMLLVLDNFEHLLDGIGLLIDILEAAPAVKLLVTSRERLNVREEWVLALDGLLFPPTLTCDLIEAYSAVQLFVERARQVQPNFSLDEDAESVITICQLTEGMPLGLELAATWLRVMSCHQIAAQMDRSLDFLTTPLRNIPQRHRSLRAVFEHSWSLLSDIERNALADLSVFRGGFDQEAAEYVAGASLPILAGLVDKSLIRLSPSSRYDLHELLRQFAADKLAESGETAAVTERHLAFFSKLADEAEAHLYGPHQEAWFDRLELEHDNLGAALVWTLKEEKSEAGLRLAGGLGWFWELRSHFHEGYIWLERLLAIHSSAPTLVRVKALQFAGVCASNLGDNQHARKFCEESLALACETGDKRRIAWALGTLGLYVELTNNLNRAISHLEEALALFRTIGDAWGISHMLRRLGWMLTSYGDYEQARILLEEALTLAREAADKNATAWALFILGNAVWLQSNGTSHRQAMTLCEESLSLAREIHDKNLLAGVLVTLGRVARTQGDYQTAQTYFKDSLVVYGEMQGRSIWTAQVLALFAGLAHTQGKLEKAARLFGAIDNFLQEYFVPFGIKASFDLDVVAVRTQLGEEAFVSAWAEGQAMTTEQAIAYALDQED